MEYFACEYGYLYRMTTKAENDTKIKELKKLKK